MAAWYLARDTEILVDLDDAHKVLAQSGGSRLEMFFRRRLRDAIRAQLLDVQSVYLADSYTPGHLHGFVTLETPMPLMERLIWQAWLGCDLFRARADLMRAERGHRYPSLLILPAPVPVRAPDAICPCDGKHDTLTASAEGQCAPWVVYRGPSPWQCFGPPATKLSDGARVTLAPGWVSPGDIMRV